MAIKYRDDEGNLIIEGVEISHPNIVNDNFRVYVNAAEKLDTFLKPAPVPILLYHQTYVDAVGEIIDVKYADSQYVDGAKAIIGTLAIKDETAATKFEKGLYKRFSIGVKPQRVICSICGKERGDCDHIVGKVYDGKLCYDKVVVDRYIEVSIVNVAADKFAVLHENIDGENILYDSIKLDMEENMAKDTKIDNADFVEYAEKIVGDSLSEDELNELQSLLAELEECEECVDEDNKNDSDLEDKQLPKAGSKARQKMKTTFCGPNKTFPVPDCKHGAVALAMLNWPRVKARYKGQIEKIRACIMRVGKKLGCAYAKKQKDDLTATLDELKRLVETIGQQEPQAVRVDLSNIETRFDNIEESLTNLVALIKDLVAVVTDRVKPVREHVGGYLIDEIKASIKESVKEYTDAIIDFFEKATPEDAGDENTDSDLPKKVIDGSIFGKLNN